MNNSKESKNYYFQLSEYLQIACNGIHSVKLKILKNSSEVGNITIDKGELLNASDNTGEGEDAFRRLVLTKNTRVELKQLGEDEKKKTIHSDCEELIFRIFTAKDKEKSLSELLKKSDHNLSPLDLKINRGLEMLIRKKYGEAMELFNEVKNESPGNIKVQHILKRLNELL